MMVAVGAVVLMVLAAVAVLTAHCMMMCCTLNTLTLLVHVFYTKYSEKQTKRTANVLYWGRPHGTLIQSVKCM
jgi:hypothetical protein